MRKFKAETASINLDQAGEQFSEVDLRDMCKRSELPLVSTITLDFDPNKPVGNIVSSELKGVKVVINGWIDAVDNKPLFVVPHGHVKRDENGKIEKFIVQGFGCVEVPTDKSLTPIKYID